MFTVDAPERTLPPRRFKLSPDKKLVEASMCTFTPRSASSTRARHRRTLGSVVAPGKVLTKAARHARKYASLAESDNEADPSSELGTTFGALAKKYLGWNFTSLADGHTKKRVGGRKLLATPNLSMDFRRLQIAPAALVIIAFLIVFGGSYCLLESLLLATRVCACSNMTLTTTVFIPVTDTTTLTLTYTPPSDTGVSPTSTEDPISTTTLHSTITEHSTVTVYSTLESTPDISPSAGTYVFAVNSGSTTWLNGYSPSSGASLAMQTTSVFVSPMETLPNSASTTTISSTITDLETVTVPAYTSTTFVMQPQSLSTITTTSTSTRYNTVYLSQVTSDSSSTASSSSSMHSPFAPGSSSSSGWNASMSAVASPVQSSSPAETYATETLTQIYYFGTGSSTTSTSTSTLTTAITVHGTTTVTPTPFSTSFQLGTGSGIASSMPSLSSPSSSGGSEAGSMTESSILAPSASNASISVATAPTSNSALSTLASAGLASSGFPSMTPGTSGIYPYANTVDPATASAVRAPSPYTLSAGVLPPPISFLTSISETSGSNATTAGALTAGASTAGASTAGASTIAVSLLSASSSSPAAQSTVSVSSDMAASKSAMVPSNGMSSQAASITGSVSSYGYGNHSMPSTLMTSPVSSESLVSAVSGISKTVAGGYYSFAYSNPLTTLGEGVSITTTLSAVANTSSGAASSAVVGSTSMAAESISLAAIDSSSSALTTPSSSPAVSGPISITATVSASGVSATSLSSSTVSPMVSSSVVGSNASAIQPAISLTRSSTSSLTALSSQTIMSGITSISTTVSDSAGQPLSTPFTSASLATATTSSSFSNPFPASSATASPTANCGEHGPFTLNFDTLPNFTPTNANTTDITQSPPIPNPYHHLTFTNGYIYAPSTREPFQPSSPPNVAVFLTNGTGLSATTLAHIHPGEIGDGPFYQSLSPFWFDAHSVSLGCDNAGPSDCVLVLSALTWSPSARAEVVTATQNATLPPCPGFRNCQLQSVQFPASFRGLSGLQIRAFVGTQERIFFMDDLSLAWSDNSCAAGLVRLQHP